MDVERNKRNTILSWLSQVDHDAEQHPVAPEMSAGAISVMKLGPTRTAISVGSTRPRRKVRSGSLRSTLSLGSIANSTSYSSRGHTPVSVSRAMSIISISSTTSSVRGRSPSPPRRAMSTISISSTISVARDRSPPPPRRVRSKGISCLPPELREMVWEFALPTIKRGVGRHARDFVEAAMPGCTVLGLCRESRAVAIYRSRRNILDALPHICRAGQPTDWELWSITFIHDGQDQTLDVFADLGSADILFGGRPRLYLWQGFDVRTLLSFFFPIRHARAITLRYPARSEEEADAYVDVWVMQGFRPPFYIGRETFARCGGDQRALHAVTSMGLEHE